MILMGKINIPKTTILCNDCEWPYVCCDHCEYYLFNADAQGRYIGLGYCKFYKDNKDPEDLCDNFCCAFLAKNKGIKDETSQKGNRRNAKNDRESQKKD